MLVGILSNSQLLRFENINMQLDKFIKWGKKAVDWSANYRKNIAKFPVMSQAKPKDVFNAIPASPPEKAEDIEDIFSDIDRHIMPGITHWQHPRFFAYFPSNAPLASVLSEYFTAVIGAQGMLWQTSPAATELEQKMIEWLRDSIGLPASYKGVIQDSASSATLAALLTMREKALEWAGNKKGLSAQKKMRVYISQQGHSSIEKNVRIAGIGDENLIKIPSSGILPYNIEIDALEKAIKTDIDKGFLPIGIVIVTGGTSIGACDDVGAVCAIAKKYNLYTHVDAAWAGTAMICPEFRYLWAGIEHADSIVFNPHKWLGAQHDCSAHFLKDPIDLVRTLAIYPEYLKSFEVAETVNFSEWSIPLGRRFRALKIWFLFRIYGLEHIRMTMRQHIKWAEELAKKIATHDDIEIVTQPILSLFSFRLCPKNHDDLDILNYDFIQKINHDGRIYLTQTKVNNIVVIRFVIGTYDCTQQDIDIAYNTIIELAHKVINSESK